MSSRKKLLCKVFVIGKGIKGKTCLLLRVFVAEAIFLVTLLQDTVKFLLTCCFVHVRSLLFLTTYSYHLWCDSCSCKEFAVCDYSLLENAVGKPVQSPAWILQDGSQWQLNFFPHGGSERSVGFVSLELCCIAFGVHSEMNARLSVSLLGHNKKEANAPEHVGHIDTMTVKSPSALPFRDVEGGRKVESSPSCCCLIPSPRYSFG